MPNDNFLIDSEKIQKHATFSPMTLTDNLLNLLISIGSSGVFVEYKESSSYVNYVNCLCGLFLSAASSHDSYR